MAKSKKRRKEIAGRLLLLRERLYGNASEMARSVRLSPQAWYNYETGRRSLDIDVAAIVVEEHGVDFNWLYGGDPNHLSPKLKALLLGDPKQQAFKVSYERPRKARRKSAAPKSKRERHNNDTGTNAG